jgi:peptidoglycan/LPS O-acetylase OafA/YrhL
MAAIEVTAGPPPAAVATGTHSPERLHALDSLRATAMLLGIVLHAGLSLSTLPVPWPAHDVQAGPGFDLMLGFIHGFRMQVFFFLAGFFAHLVWQRMGTRAFLRQRAERIGLPFAAGLVLIIPLIMVIWRWADPVFMAMMTQRPPALLDYPTGHLWFLEMLLFLYAAMAGLVWCARWPWVAAWAPRVDAAFDWLVRRWYKPLLLALPTAWVLASGPFIPEIDRAGMRLLPSFGAFIYYGLFFALGCWLHRRLPLLDQLRRWAAVNVALAVAGFLVFGGLMQALQRGVASAWVPWAALYAWALYSWAMTFALTGLFLRFAGGHRPWVRYLADASYWWYLWHIPVLMPLQALIAKSPVNGWLKLAFLLAAAVAVLWPSYHWGVRYTWIGRILNGPRVRPPTARAAVA